VERPGLAGFDSRADAWFASANGKLVRVEPTRLVVLADGVQGRDVDAQLSRSIAVSREPGDRIVLHRWGAAGTTHVTLLQGEGYFHPRLAPDGESVLVSLSHPDGGRMVQVSPDGEKRDLGQGYGPVWHPDGDHVLFSRFEHDGYRIQSSKLYMRSMKSGAEHLLMDWEPGPWIEAAVSPDGLWLALVSTRTGKAHVWPFPPIEAWQEVEK